ncbi:MAG: TetR/AcrR family transcriptional regulator [Xanthobacteraceae bacterium]
MRRQAKSKAVVTARGKTGAKAPVQARGKSASGPRSRRAEKSAARREAILAAALDEFAARGFAATRLDDVATRANVAKGTIYLHFRDKETLFQELIRSALSPFIATIEAAPAADMPFRAVLELLVRGFVQEVYGTKRKNIVRLVLAEGRRFPKVAEFYYREVVGRAMAAMRKLVQRGVARGELRDDSLARFPQLIVAPALVAIVWEGLFDRFEKLDPEEMMRAHFNLLFAGLERKP